MKSVLFLVIVFFILLTASCKQMPKQDEYFPSVIPAPQQLEVQKGEFKFSESTRVYITDNTEELEKTGYFLIEKLNEYYRIDLELMTTEQPDSDDPAIYLVIDATLEELGSEGYQLLISDADVQLKSNSYAGIFYGIQTILQLVQSEVGKKNSGYWLPAVRISDTPRFTWRGMHLDVSRHFFDREFIKKYIDILAAHKMNIFHWHLTDDQGWRIEIKKYPRLTELGAWREDRTDAPWDYDQKITNAPGKKLYGGYYTQDEIREIVDYAKDRFITIVPEIEIPGHSQAAMTAYPHLSCSGKPYTWPPDVAFEFTDPYCLGNDSTFIFLKDVLLEVLELFPSEYIHIGGDEAKKTPWMTCPKCQALMKKEGLKDVDHLQSYIIREIGLFLNEQGRKIIGWDEIMEGGLAPGAAVMSWRGNEGGIEATKLGHPVVMTPAYALYFNRRQADPYQDPMSAGRILSIYNVYQYDPVPEEIVEENVPYVMGAQACLWAEGIQTPEQAEYQLLPRLCALSELTWSRPEKKVWKDFSNRLEQHYSYLDNLDVNYFIPPPGGLANRVFYQDETEVILTSSLKNAEIRYTTDGSPPGIESNLYSDPLKINKSTIIMAMTVMPNGKSSETWTGKIKKESLRIPVEITTDLSAGLKYNYYEGSIETLNDFEQLNLIDSGVVSNFNIPSDAEKDFFGYSFSGLIYIEKEGVYTFFTNSDDGSILYIHNELLINNDGIHGANMVGGQIALAAGYHPLYLHYFENRYGQHLEVLWSGDGFEMEQLPDEVLFHRIILAKPQY